MLYPFPIRTCMASDTNSASQRGHHGCARVGAASDSANSASTTSRCSSSERRERRSSHAKSARPSTLRALRGAVPILPASGAPHHARRIHHDPLALIFPPQEYPKTSTTSTVPFVSEYRGPGSPDAEGRLRTCIAETACQLSSGVNRMNDHADVALP